MSMRVARLYAIAFVAVTAVVLWWLTEVKVWVGDSVPRMALVVGALGTLLVYVGMSSVASEVAAARRSVDRLVEVVYRASMERKP